MEIHGLSPAVAQMDYRVNSIPFTRLPGFSKSWLAVTSGAGESSGLFLRSPASIDACAEAAKETLGKARPWKELASIIRDSGKQLGVPDETLSRLDLLAEGKAVMVVTGQQVGYLGGPLYTFLKAYHAVRLAQELEKELRIPVLPLFWLEGRDHDLEEVRHASWVDSTGELRKSTFSPETEISGFEVGRYRVSAEEHIQELAAGIESPDETGLEILLSAYTDTTLADGMGRFLAATLGSRGLLIIEGMDPRLKALAAPLWEKIVSAGPRLTEIFSQRAKELESAGWNTPMAPTPDSYLFYLTREHRRASLTYDGQLKHPDGHTEHLTRDELITLIRRDPDAISPKAALRPPYQDYIFPTIAYVAGPGEMDYQAQLTPFYKEFGISAPSLFPRLSATMVDQRISRQLEKLHLTVEQILSTPPHELSREILRSEDQGQTTELIDKSRAEIQAVFDRLKQSLSEIDPNLAGTVQVMAGKSLHPLEHLREKTDKALKQKYAVTVSRLEKLLNSLHPTDKLAERVLCGGYYMVKYGPEKLLRALDGLPAIPNEHLVVTVE